MDQNNYVNGLGEDDLELKRFVAKGNKLKWTWIIGIPVIVVCVMYGDASQWLLSIFIAIYIFITTRSYFKSNIPGQ